MAFVQLSRLTARPIEHDTVVRNLIESAKLFDGDPACLLYLVTESVDSPHDIWVVDVWTDEEAHSNALQAPELQPYIAETKPLLTGVPEQIRLTPRGGKGLPIG
jgi:quinol monooxygenase YgiN